jgi:hypothetical protein
MRILATLQVSRQHVEKNFREWDMLEGVNFVEGFFNESIPRDVPPGMSNKHYHHHCHHLTGVRPWVDWFGPRRLPYG